MDHMHHSIEVLPDILRKRGRIFYGLNRKNLKQKFNILILNLYRSNESNIQICHEILLTQLNKEHSEIRYAAIQIIDMLFQRSNFFRELILEEFQEFFELVLGRY
jgi:hypothetical protein